MNTKKRLKTSTFGTCSYAATSPEEISSETSIVNVILSFEEALKLNLAIDECVRQLNRYNKSTKEGKRAALCLSVHVKQHRISIHESKT